MPLVNTLSNLKATSAEPQQKAHEHHQTSTKAHAANEHTIKPQQSQDCQWTHHQTLRKARLLVNTPSNLTKTKTVSEHTIKPQQNLDC